MKLLANITRINERSYLPKRIFDLVFALVMGVMVVVVVIRDCCQAVEMPERNSGSWALQEVCVVVQLQLVWFSFSQQLIHISELRNIYSSFLILTPVAGCHFAFKWGERGAIDRFHSPDYIFHHPTQLITTDKTGRWRERKDILWV